MLWVAFCFFKQEAFDVSQSDIFMFTYYWVIFSSCVFILFSLTAVYRKIFSIVWRVVVLQNCMVKSPLILLKLEAFQRALMKDK